MRLVRVLYMTGKVGVSRGLNLITGCNKVQKWYNPEKEILEHVCVLFSLLFSIILDSSK